MKVIVTLLGIALAGIPLAGFAHAGDAAAPSSNGAPLASKVDQDINQAVSGDARTSSDVDSRIKDLEETRTAIDQKRPPTVSLSVSGWVDQQVQYNMKQ